MADLGMRRYFTRRISLKPKSSAPIRADGSGAHATDKRGCGNPACRTSPEPVPAQNGARRPRPHLPEEVALYKPIQRKVLTIRPGITGMAQISGRADLDFDDEVRLDIHYLEHWGPWMDLYILLKTPLVVLFRKGAY